MKFVKAVTFTLTTRVLILVFGTVFSIMLARTLGPEGNGILAMVLALTALLSQLGNLGLHTSGMFLVARDRALLDRVSANSFWVSVLGGSILALSSLVVFYFYPRLYGTVPFLLLAIAFLAIPFNLLTLFFQNLLLAIKNVRAYNLIELFWRFVYLFLGGIFLLSLKFKITEIILLTSGISIALALNYAFHYLKQEKSNFLIPPDLTLLSQMLKLGFRIYLGGFFYVAILRVTIFLINYYQGSEATGIFSVAASLGEILNILPSTLGLILFPQVSANLSDRGELTAAVSRHTLVLMGLICAIFALFAKPLILLLYGSAFSASGGVFLWLLPGVFFIALETLYLNDIVARGIPPMTYLIPGVAFLASLVLNLLFIPRWGVTGGAISISLAYFLMFLLALISFLRLTPVKLARVLLPDWGELKTTFKQEVLSRIVQSK